MTEKCKTAEEYFILLRRTMDLVNKLYHDLPLGMHGCAPSDLDENIEAAQTAADCVETAAMKMAEVREAIATACGYASLLSD